MILNRGNQQSRRELWGELEKAGFDHILSIENASANYDTETVPSDFPFVRFIFLNEPVSRGEEINIAASEISSPLFFLMWSDMQILRSGTADRMVERLQTPHVQEPLNVENGQAVFSTEGKSQFKRLCTVPLIQNGHNETIPTIITPALIYQKKSVISIKTILSSANREATPSLCPFDGIGIYDRERFIRSGGFDPSIKSFYWQLMDFGFRCNLWGEKIAGTKLIKLAYKGDVPERDGTADDSYKRFFLKNLSPVFRGDYAHIPLRRFPWYYRTMGSGLSAAWDEFSATREWVNINRYRFTSDARALAESWESLDVSSAETDDDALSPLEDSH